MARKKPRKTKNMLRGKKPRGKKKNKTVRKKKSQVVVSGTVKEITKKPQVVVRGTRQEIKAMWEREAVKYREILRGYEGFDLGERKAPISYAGLSAHSCEKKRCCKLVLRYAKFGLHRYNLREGKDLRLSCVKRYNKTRGIVDLCSYYITLEANDPASDPATLQTLEVRVDERECNDLLVLKCSVARLRGETKENKIYSHLLYDDIPFMPELPPENPFKDDSSRFYVLKESELQDNDHWIRLYLELTVAATDLSDRKNTLTNLKIIKVAMESTPYLSEGFRAHEGTFYIRYHDSCEDRVGKDFDRVAIVRSALDENIYSKVFGLVGLQDSSHNIIPDNMEAASSSSAQQD